MNKLSVFVTTFNNGRTLDACLAAVAWADEIVVLDSFSTDDTLDIARRYRARVFQHEFMGYGPQKQMALEHTSNRWVLLFDADEVLTASGQHRIRELLAGEPNADGYAMPRIEQMFWRMCSERARLNHFLRLFDRNKGRISDMPIHAAPIVEGRVEKLDAPFYHFGEVDIHTKVDKVNHYSSGLVADKVAKGRRPSPWLMVIYPPLVFLRLFLFKRNVVNGWAGFITSVVGAFYAFMRYAKLYEYQQRQRHGTSMLPPEHPDHTQPPPDSR